MSCDQLPNGRTTALLKIEAAITMNTDIKYFTRHGLEVLSFEHTDVPQRGAGSQLKALAAIAATFMLYPLPASAADLKPETTQAWQEYIKSAEARSQKRLADGSP